MGRCEPRTYENDPGLITLPEGIDELGDAVKSEFDVTTKQVCCVSSRGFEQKEHRKLSSLSIGSAHAF